MVELEAAFLSVRNSNELIALFKIVFTQAELKAYRKRWQAMQMSAAGKTQREISAALRIGVATATRSAKASVIIVVPSMQSLPERGVIDG